MHADHHVVQLVPGGQAKQLANQVLCRAEAAVAQFSESGENEEPASGAGALPGWRDPDPVDPFPAERALRLAGVDKMVRLWNPPPASTSALLPATPAKSMLVDRQWRQRSHNRPRRQASARRLLARPEGLLA